jgi:GH18 family chitinase
VNAKGWQRSWDDAAWSPYLLYQGEGGKRGLITYDDPLSTARKTYYVLVQRDFGGMFMWDLSGDYDGNSQDLLDAMYAVKKIAEQ